MDSRVKSLKWLEKKSDKKERPGIMSVALASNISEPRQRELDFDRGELADFSEDNKEKIKLIIYDKNHRDGKRIVLTPFQHRLVTALSFLITRERNTEDDIKALSETIMNTSIRNGDLPLVRRVIDIKSLSKLIYGGRKLKKNDLNKVRNEIENLCHIKQAFITPDKTRLIIRSIISVEEDAIGLTKEGEATEENEWQSYIRFNPMFFYGINNRYATIPVELFKLASTKGSGAETDLFWQMLNQLWKVYWQHKVSYDNAVRKAQKEYPKDDPEGLAKALKDAERKLHYDETSVTIKSRATFNYEDNRKHKRFLEDMTKACKCYTELKLITTYKMEQTATGEKWHFWFNPDYNKLNEQPAAMLSDGEE